MMSPIPEAVSSRAGGIVEPVSCYLLWDPRGHVLLVEKEHGEGDWFVETSAAQVPSVQLFL